MSAPEAPPTLRWVGFGASAGGLEALGAIVRRLEPTGRACFVVAQHSSPSHKSMLAALLRRQTALAVVELGEAPTPPQPDVIYVAPPNADVLAENGALRLAPANLAPGAPKPSVNRLFLSLAAQVGERAVAVVLSGTGSDGAYGVQAVRAAGGVTLAQEPATAKYDGMPRAALQTGCVDLALPPEAIGVRLSALADAPTLRPDEAARDLDDLLAALRVAQGVDFRAYKRGMVERRVERRMAALGFDDLPGYAAHACADAVELAALYRDLMISVTAFFRDPDEFEALGRRLAPRLAETGEPFRIWVAGCATGEEAYSALILAAEALGGPEALGRRRVQAFATDIDDAALAVARRGVYPREAFDRMTPARLERFFEPHPEGLVVVKPLRDAVAFTRHNLAQDPPFRRIDLICCRNLLIYFGAELQARTLNLLRYALKPEGLLFLGKAETAAATPDAFRPSHGNPRILAPSALTPPATTVFGARRPEAERGTLRRDARAVDELGAARVERAMFDAAVRGLGGDCLLVSADMRVRRCYGAVGRFLEPGEGDFGADLARLLHPKRRREAMTLVGMALRGAGVATGPERTPPDEPDVLERLRAAPIDAGPGQERLALLCFERRAAPAPAAAGDAPVAPDAARLAALEADLEARDRSLSMTIEELETANEELQALNAEMQAANEELQSANEELQTANEELQSTNQELTTVNEELQIRSAELAETAGNLSAVLAHVAKAVVVVDARLRITAASDEARRLFRIPPAGGDATPDVETCREPPGFPRLAGLFRTALAERRCERREIDLPDRAFDLTVAPYLSPAGALSGAIAVATDETERRERTRRLEAAMARLSASNAELERFSYVASHDLKEPVRTLGGYADCLADPALALSEAERAEILGAISVNTRRLAEIIDGLLAFSRLDREVAIEDVDLTAMAGEAVAALRAAIEAADARVEIRPLPRVRASRVHLRQLFQNLIGNALKFRGEGPCRIVVAATAEPEPVISVEDNGPGVPASAREAVFEVFRRLRPRDEVDGSGLGLSICRKIVDQYRGRLWCDDSVLGGAAFRFTLPGA
jgi:chemotaxis methyl-accepting protein methylase/signal transduction histidine kinase